MVTSTVPQVRPASPTWPAAVAVLAGGAWLTLALSGGRTDHAAHWLVGAAATVLVADVARGRLRAWAAPVAAIGVAVLAALAEVSVLQSVLPDAMDVAFGWLGAAAGGALALRAPMDDHDRALLRRAAAVAVVVGLALRYLP